MWAGGSRLEPIVAQSKKLPENHYSSENNSTTKLGPNNRNGARRTVFRCTPPSYLALARLPVVLLQRIRHCYQLARARRGCGRTKKWERSALLSEAHATYQIFVPYFSRKIFLKERKRQARITRFSLVHFCFCCTITNFAFLFYILISFRQLNIKLCLALSSYTRTHYLSPFQLFIALLVGIYNLVTFLSIQKATIRRLIGKKLFSLITFCWHQKGVITPHLSLCFLPTRTSKNSSLHFLLFSI